MADRILVIGACGQIGTELTEALRIRYGFDNVIASDIRKPNNIVAEGLFVTLNLRSKQRIIDVIKKYNIKIIYQLAALLSAKGEYAPTETWRLNVEYMLQLLEISRQLEIVKLFFPSSIAVFGSLSPKSYTPQFCYCNPTTMYGISKLSTEHLCNYYYSRYHLDVRSLRYPGLISFKQQAGGGTTDYAVEMLAYAQQDKPYTCFLAKDTELPMMYMEDAIRGTIALMEADANNLSVRTSYNFSAISFTPHDLHKEITQYCPNFNVNYAPDFRQNIAKYWPKNIDDSVAQKDWFWQPKYTLSDIVQSIFKSS